MKKVLCAVTHRDDIFTCPNMPGGLRLSVASCADSYRRGKTAQAWQTLHHCKGCAIGALHAGEAPPVEKPRYRCSCGAQSTRLIQGVLCVSCYNRLAEALKGRNARGKRPLKWRAVHLSAGKWGGTSAPALTFVRRGLFLYVGQSKPVAIARAPWPFSGNQRSLLETDDAIQ